jgi:hypothetical protein
MLHSFTSLTHRPRERLLRLDDAGPLCEPVLSVSRSNSGDDGVTLPIKNKILSGIAQVQEFCTMLSAIQIDFRSDPDVISVSLSLYDVKANIRRHSVFQS